MSYNGYTNYATWCVCLWLDNDSTLYNYWSDRAFDTALPKLADELEEYFKHNIPDISLGVYSDLLQSALVEVNWLEVAKSRIPEEK